MEARVVKFSLLCRTHRVGLMRGKDNENVNRIRSETRARVSINPSHSYHLVTLSSEETKDSSPSTEAAIKVLPYCLEKIDRSSYKICLLVEESQRSCISEEMIADCMNQTTALVSLSLFDKNTYVVQITGGNHAVKNSLQLVLTRLRNSIFQ